MEQLESPVLEENSELLTMIRVETSNYPSLRKFLKSTGLSGLLVKLRVYLTSLTKINQALFPTMSS